MSDRYGKEEDNGQMIEMVDLSAHNENSENDINQLVYDDAVYEQNQNLPNNNVNMPPLENVQSNDKKNDNQNEDHQKEEVVKEVEDINQIQNDHPDVYIPNEVKHEEKVEEKAEEKAEEKPENKENSHEEKKEPAAEQQESKIQIREMSDEELQRRINEANARELAAKERRKKEQQLEKLRKAEERRIKKEQREEEKKKKAEANKGKPKLFDMGFTPALGFLTGAAIGFVLKIGLIVAPMLVLSFTAGLFKIVSHAVKTVRYNRNQALKNREDRKKEDQKELEDSKKSEKELDKANEKEREKVKSPEIKEKEAKKDKQTLELEKQKNEISGKRAKFNEWTEKKRLAELDKLNNIDKKLSFEEQKKQFVKHLYRATVLTEMQLLDKSGVKTVSQMKYKGAYESMVKDQKNQWQFEKMTEEIKQESDFKKFADLAAKDGGLGIYNELAKHHTSVAKVIEKAKQPEKNLQKENPNMNKQVNAPMM